MVSDISAGDGKTCNLFYSVPFRGKESLFTKTYITQKPPAPSPPAGWNLTCVILAGSWFKRARQQPGLLYKASGNGLILLFLPTDALGLLCLLKPNSWRWLTVLLDIYLFYGSHNLKTLCNNLHFFMNTHS